MKISNSNTYLLIDVENSLIRESAASTLDEMHRDINTDIITVRYIIIENKEFVLICDDEGLLKDNPIISVYDRSSFFPAVVGNVLIGKQEGDKIVFLTPEEKRMISKKIKRFNDLLILVV